MRRKLAIIFALAVVFASILVFRPWELGDEDTPRFFDRLPDADLIGKANILELSETIESTTYHYRIPYREFLTREFILQQSKAFGINIQQPAYFFANEIDWKVEDFGAMIMVKDSSLVNSGIQRLSRFTNLKDTTVYDKKVFKIEDLHLAYGKDWLLIYNGKNFKRIFHDVLFARKNEIPPNWREFLNKTNFQGSPVVAHFTSPNLSDYGLTAADFRVKNDSSSLTLSAEVSQEEAIGIALKESGPVFEKQEYTKTLANLHLDITGLRNNPNDPLVKIMKQVASKVSFPVQDFLLAWDGDVALRQGGLQKYRERYIESELDENFNVSEVVKYKTITVPGYSVYLSMNNKYPDFLDRLIAKGILTKPDKRYRFLFSPPMILEEEEGSVTLHTASYFERPITGPGNSVMFTLNKTPYTFYLDSLHTNTYYCRLHIPLHEIVEDNVVPDDL